LLQPPANTMAANITPHAVNREPVIV
jgi:hypothetical protein